MFANQIINRLNRTRFIVFVVRDFAEMATKWIRAIEIKSTGRGANCCDFVFPMLISLAGMPEFREVNLVCIDEKMELVWKNPCETSRPVAIRSSNVQDRGKFYPMPAQPNKGLLQERLLPPIIGLTGSARTLSGRKPLDLKAELAQSLLNGRFQKVFHCAAKTRPEIFAQRALTARYGWLECFAPARSAAGQTPGPEQLL